VTPPTLSQELAQTIAGARYEAIERAGHLSNLERPDEFNAVVGDFLHGVAP
jgi:pimeloyl-ACP methyl ester carboxylesterase